MPDTRRLIDEGLGFEKGGVPAKALDRYGRALDAATDPAHAAEALCRMSHVHRDRTAWAEALDAARRSAELANDAGLKDALAEALNASAAVHISRGDFDEAESLLERALDAASDPRVRGVALQNLGSVAGQRGDFETATERFHESGEYFRRAGYAWGEAVALNNVAAIALDRGRYGRASRLAGRAADAARRVGDLDLVAVATLSRAEAHGGLGEYEKAEELASEALGYFATTENQWRRVYCMRVLGDLSRRRDADDTALRFYRAALELAERVGADRDATLLRDRLAELDPGRDT